MDQATQYDESTQQVRALVASIIEAAGELAKVQDEITDIAYLREVDTLIWAAVEAHEDGEDVR